MTLQIGKQTITINILPDISESKSSETEIWPIDRK